jgi:hypothetical protein
MKNLNGIRTVCIFGAFVFPVLAHAQTSTATNGMWQDISNKDALTGNEVFEIAINPTADTDNVT